MTDTITILGEKLDEANAEIKCQKGLLVNANERIKVLHKYLGESLAREVLHENTMRTLGAQADNMRNLYIGGYKTMFMTEAAKMYRMVERMIAKQKLPRDRM